MTGALIASVAAMFMVFVLKPSWPMTLLIAVGCGVLGGMWK